MTHLPKGMSISLMGGTFFSMVAWSNSFHGQFSMNILWELICVNLNVKWLVLSWLFFLIETTFEKQFTVTISPKCLSVCKPHHGAHVHISHKNELAFLLHHIFYCSSDNVITSDKIEVLFSNITISVFCL